APCPSGLTSSVTKPPFEPSGTRGRGAACARKSRTPTPPVSAHERRGDGLVARPVRLDTATRGDQGVRREGEAMRTLRAAVVFVALVATTMSAAAAPPLQPLVVDWQQYFRIDSESAVRDGRAILRGTVWNTAPWPTKRIQLLVEAVDAGGQVTNQRVVWLGVDLAPGTHATFEAPMPLSPGYRVSVFAFDSARGGAGS